MTVASIRDHALEAAAANDVQRLAIFNPDPEVNSLVEVYALLAHGADPTVRSAFRTVLLQLRAANDTERECERLIAVLAERPEPGRLSTGAKAIAGRIGQALDVLIAHDQAPVSASEFLEASGAVKRELALVPAEQLFRPAVANQLGGRRMRKLEQVVSSAEAAA